ncbi:hypothetical protein OG894_43775 (plasmid) [Streptomyces sp. NBC_01724]|nr:hypothetical protein [Streptomyces sp. NBC_01724]
MPPKTKAKTDKNRREQDLQASFSDDVGVIRRVIIDVDFSVLD